MICVSIADVAFNECLDAVKQNELCELRLDRLDLSDDELTLTIKAARSVIITCRHSNLSEESLFQKSIFAINAGATYLDIELRSKDVFKDRLMAHARSKGCKIIISYHNYEKTPTKKELDAIVEDCKCYSPDIIKIACLSNGDADNARLLGLLDSDSKMIVVGMGEKGRLTRLVATELGSFCSYVSISKDTKTAPGQLTKDELNRFLDVLYYV